MENKMKVEIGSDVMCPFCYIGKRKFDFCPSSGKICLISVKYIILFIISKYLEYSV